jgi:ADP-L-glycero-D-manno-heptose 6-epimerase
VFASWFAEHAKDVSLVFHFGARTDTTDQNKEIFDKLNLGYSKSIWAICSENEIPLIYASSAATYGLGEFGYVDSHVLVDQYKPLNEYAISKNEFDKWALMQSESPPKWYGLKFFNVYGPNEFHKKRMASVVWHAFNQIRHSGKMQLFRSHKPGIPNGQQKRDFIYVKDVLDLCTFFMENPPANGLYNIGTGKARAFLDLARGVFQAMQIAPNIEWIDTPENIRESYQYFTEADLGKLRNAGWDAKFTSLESGIEEYVKSYLVNNTFY